MGIKTCGRGSVLWKATGLSLDSLQAFDIGKRIDVDANLLFCSLQRNRTKNKTIEDTVEDLALLLKEVAHGGFIVTIVIDGDARPDCKRATLKRRKGDSLTKINRMYCRFKVLELSSRLEKEAMNENKRSEIKNELQSFNDAAKSLERKCDRFLIRDDFSGLLLHRLKSINAFKKNKNGGFVCPKILKAKFQADYVIALRSVEGKNDFIYSCDGDFAALIGNECVMIDKIQNKGNVFEVSLAGPCNKKMLDLRRRLKKSKLKSSGITWIKAKYPLFQDQPQDVRAMIAIALGCDVWIDGIKQVGVSAIKKNWMLIEKRMTKQ